MSPWKFGDFEAVVDFTDAATMRKLDEAYEILLKESDEALKVGKQYEIIESQCAVYEHYFDYVFGPGTHEKMYQGKKSVLVCIASAESFNDYREAMDREYMEKYQKFIPQNRTQRRNDKRRNGKQHQR